MKEKPTNRNLEQAIDAYIKGELSDEEVQALWVELLKQPEYISLLQTEVDVSRIYRQKAENQSGTTYYWKWIASAAAVILIAITLNIFTGNNLQPINEWSQQSFSLSEHLASAEVTRSVRSAVAPPDSLLNVGFKAAISGQVETARTIFERIIQQYGNIRTVSKAHLNLGILNYNAGDFTASINDFNEAISLAADDSLLIEQSYWYLGNAYIHTDQLNQALDAVQQAYNMGDIYKKEAFKLLKRLDYELGNIDFDDFQQQIEEIK